MRQPTTGQEGLIGKRAKVVTPISREGKVFVHGEYWNAESDEAFEVGDTVEIVSVSELMLKVKSVSK
jgi:membrane-bound serine protease (ClpP class)